jgi:Fic family protein
MGIMERLPAEKKGRGYSNLYKLVQVRVPCDLFRGAKKEHLAFVRFQWRSSQTRLNLAMTALSPEQCHQALTSSQRLVADSFEYSWDVLTIKDIRKETKGKVSVKTIRRALKKLCDMGIMERLPAEKKGRGYSNLYQLA